MRLIVKFRVDITFFLIKLKYVAEVSTEVFECIMRDMGPCSIFSVSRKSLNLVCVTKVDSKSRSRDYFHFVAHGRNCIRKEVLGDLRNVYRP